MKQYITVAAVSFEGEFKCGVIDTIKVVISPTEVQMLNNKTVTHLDMEGFLGPNIVNFSVTITSPGTILGIYKMKGVYDVGTIKLNPTGNTHIDYGPTRDNSWCVIF